MRCTQVCVLLAATFVGSLPVRTAGASPAAGWFVGADASHVTPNVSEFSSGTGYGVRTGYRWSVSDRFDLGAETGYDRWPRFHGPFQLENHGWLLGANARLHVAERWFLGGRAGKLFSDTTADYGFSRSSGSLTRDYAGFELGWDVSEHASVSLGYTHVPDVRKHAVLRGGNLPVTEIFVGASESAINVEYRF